MGSDNIEKSTLPSVAASTRPTIWRRCVEIMSRRSDEADVALDPEPMVGWPGSKEHRVPSWKAPAFIGYIVIILTFGVLGTWSAFAKLASAVVAPGVVTLESSRKVIQHFENGIVAKILVHEGEHVDQGQVLFVLDDTAAQANATAVQNQLYAFLAQEARLVAERDGATKVTYPQAVLERADQQVVRDAINDENKQFAQRHATLAGEVDILNSRIEQYRTQIKGISDQKTATEQQLGFINSELTDLRGLLEQNLVQKTRVLALQREQARLRGVIGQSVADIAKAENDINEAHLQIDQLHKKFSEDVNSQILQVREKIAETREKTIVSEDVLQRTHIRAPVSGTIQNLHVATVGGVIGAAQPLAELIPDNENLVVDAQVSPSDSDAIDSGMAAEVRFSTFHGYTLPLIMGRVDTVSRDRIVNEQTKQDYFLARVVVDKTEIPKLIENRIKAGMPVEVVVPTGERTVISYLTRPLRNRASSAFREK
ncbi:MAG TPA: HlyD family type I secretion periplasmic adaptor subunit [Candidatus Binataceae bacterium]|nr:HlyD family type I secretion periplasmic adaptor subunit [Candidatus Binataceae bacterium]